MGTISALFPADARATGASRTTKRVIYVMRNDIFKQFDRSCKILIKNIKRCIIEIFEGYCQSKKP